jgi:PAS domain S-box-containing protein
MSVYQAELDEALAACDFPLVVWEPPGTVCMVNQAFEKLLGLARDQLIGCRLTNLFAPADAVGTTLATLSSGAVEGVRAKRQLLCANGRTISVWDWARRMELRDDVVCVSIDIPADEVGRLGRDPAAVWRDLAAVAVGAADDDLRIERVSADVRDVLGYDPADLIGSSLLSMIHPDDFEPNVPSATGSYPRVALPCQLRMRRADGTWAPVRLLTACCPKAPDLTAFAIVGAPDPPLESVADRIAALELRLRRIAAEVRAAGILEGIIGIPGPSEHPQLGDLTSRQWEILSHLLRGERVPRIAAALYLSPSTVRNHLSAIFRKFAVHSQSEVIALLRG